MGATEQDIRQMMFDNYGQRPVTILGKVTEVDNTARTCTVDDDGVEMFGVRMQCVTDGESGVLVRPKVGAQVLIMQIEGSEEYMVVHASEVDWIEIVLDGYKVKGDKDGVVFNEGTEGMVKVSKMVEWMNKVKTDLSEISTVLEGLGVTVAITTPVAVQSNFEDAKIKH